MMRDGDLLVEITARGVTVAPRGEISRARGTFARRHGVRLPGLVAPALAAHFRDAIASAPFVERVDAEIDPPVHALGLADDALHDELIFLLNDQRFFDVVERLAGRGRIGCYSGTVRTHVPGAGHHDTWHDDVGDDQMLTLSVNFSSESYQGGRVQVREEETGRVTFDATATGLGDGLLFEISPRLTHRVTDMEGTASRTVLSGWFHSRPSHRRWLAARFARLEARTG